VISVIITTYNRSFLISRAIDSVLNQSLQPYEIIVVNDGSSDDTKRVLDQYRDIKVIDKKNGGISSARNIGITKASGDYIAFLDDDDIWHRDKLKLQFALNSVFSHTDEIWLRNKIEVQQKSHHKKPDGWCFYDNLEFCKISPSTVMIKRDIFKQVGLFDERLEVCEDYDMWLRILKSYPVQLLPKRLTVKSAGESEQLSLKYFAMDKFRIQSLKKFPYDIEVQKVLSKKIDILKKGAIKHSNHKLLEFLKDF
jgi:glycosyltransferase involved in cell wall biosynthesis